MLDADVRRVHALADATRLEASAALEPARKAALGQFMTPSVTAEFMASLFATPQGNVRLLDAGAGVGSLTLAFVAKAKGARVDAELWEIDPVMRRFLGENIEHCRCLHPGLLATVHEGDFVDDAVAHLAAKRGECFDYAILNPPYGKLRRNSGHRALLRRVGLEAVNLYAAFVALAVLLTKPGGEIVAILPRSFCNGPYYRPFRRLIQEQCALRQIHLFESRTAAFKDDNVLQETVVIHLEKGAPQGNVVVSASRGPDYESVRRREVAFAEVVRPDDAQRFIHIPLRDARRCRAATAFRNPLAALGLEVSTGPVVDFRLKGLTHKGPEPGAVPLLYPHHFRSGTLCWPDPGHKKPNAIRVAAASRRWLMPNDWYVIVKRFSSKEEKRRIVAHVFDPRRFDADLVGFENHWNVFHAGKAGIGKALATGLAAFLNTSAVDEHFRAFSGHTQVNATDLRSIRFPTRAQLVALGRRVGCDARQTQLDAALAELDPAEPDPGDSAITR